MRHMVEVPQPEYVTPIVRADGPIKLAEYDPSWVEQFAREGDTHPYGAGLPVSWVTPRRFRRLFPFSPLSQSYISCSSSGTPQTSRHMSLNSRQPDTCCICESPTGGEHRLLKDHNPDVQIHVFTVGSSEVERMLLFRDRLRSHIEERDLYERTKRELAARQWVYTQDYADAKSSVVEGVIARANADLQSPKP